MKALKKHNFKEHLSTTMSSQVRAEWDDTEWTVYVKQGLADSLESLLEAGLRFYQFKTECRSMQGGSDFSKLAVKLFGVSASYAREWAKIGERYELLQQYADKLPSSIYLLKEIAAQPVEKITWAIEGGFIHANMVREDLGVIKKYDLAAVEKEREALSGSGSGSDSGSGDGDSKLNDMSASSGTGDGGSTVDEISFTDDSDDQSGAGTSEAHKEKSEDKSSVDPAFKLLEKALENSCYGDIQFSYFNIPGHNCEIVMSLDSYAGLMTLVAKILQFDNEQEDVQEVDPNQGFLDLGYQKQTFIPAKRDNTDSSDPLYEQAVTITQVTQRCSVSALQRKLQVGYNRAFRIVKQMEETGIVSELKANGLREVLPFYEKDEIQGEQ